MERGYITIKENEYRQWVVDAKLINSTLWLTEHEIAALFNVFVSSVGSNLRSIFKSGLLREENVTTTHKYVNKGRQCEVKLYNLEVLISISYRLASYEATAFRNWVMKSLTEQINTKPKKEKGVLIVCLSPPTVLN